MVEYIEEIRRHPQVHCLREVEVFEQRKVQIPGSRTSEKGTTIRIVKVSDRGQTDRSIGQLLLHKIIGIRAELTHNSLSRIRIDQLEEITTRHISRLRRVEIAPEP